MRDVESDNLVQLVYMVCQRLLKTDRSCNRHRGISWIIVYEAFLGVPRSYKELIISSLTNSHSFTPGSVTVATMRVPARAVFNSDTMSLEASTRRPSLRISPRSRRKIKRVAFYNYRYCMNFSALSKLQIFASVPNTLIVFINIPHCDPYVPYFLNARTSPPIPSVKLSYPY